MGEMRLRLTKKHSKLLQRILAFALAFAMICPDAGMLGGVIAKADTDEEVLEAQTVSENQTGTITLNFSEIKKAVLKDDGVEVSSVDGLYSKNNTTTTLGNQNTTIGQTLYMDRETRVALSYEASEIFNMYFTSKQNSDVTSNTNMNDTSWIIDNENKLMFQNTTTNAGLSGKIIIDASHCPVNTQMYEQNIRLVGNQGHFDFTLKICVLTPTKAFKLDAKNDIRQGRTTDFSVIKDSDSPYNLGTDSYNWSIVGDTLGSAIVAKTNTQLASFTAGTKSTGAVIVRAETGSGISETNEQGHLVALTSRGVASNRSITVFSWNKAATVGFKIGDEEIDNPRYKFAINDTVALDKLVYSKTDKQTQSNDYLSYRIEGTGSNNNNINWVYSTNENATTPSYTFTAAGSYKLTVTAETPTVTRSCEFEVYKNTPSISIYLNDYANSSADMTGKSGSVRSNNEFVLYGVEGPNCDEPLDWTYNNDNGELLSYSPAGGKLIDGHIRAFNFHVGQVDHSTTVDMTIKTNRTAIGGAAANVQATYKLTIEPALSSSVGLKTLYTPVNSGYNVITSPITSQGTIDLYPGEKAEVITNPADDSVMDQIVYDVKGASACVTKTDSATVLNKTEVTYALRGDSPANLVANAKSTSQGSGTSVTYGVSNTTAINTKAGTKSVKLALEGNEAASQTVNVDQEYELEATVTSTDSNIASAESLYWESESSDVTFVGSNGVESAYLADAGETVSIKTKAKANEAVIRVYAMHKHGDVIHKSSTAAATLKLKIVDAGTMTIEPTEYTDQYSKTKELIAKVYYDGTTSPIPYANVKWTTSNASVAGIKSSSSTDQLSKAVIGLNKVGKAIITGKYNDKLVQSSSFTVTAPLTDTKIILSGVNTSTGTQTVDSYVYLPNGQKPAIAPVLTADGIDARGDSYDLKANSDYVLSETLSNGGEITSYNAGDYKLTFTEGENGLYTGSKSYTYKIYQKDLSSSDPEIKVVQNDKLIYNGLSQEPNLTITYTKDGTSQILVKGTDYTVSGAKTEATPEGESYNLTIAGTGNFKGTITVPYVIYPYDIEKNFSKNVWFTDSKGQKVSENSIPEKTYTATAIEPTGDIKVTALIDKNTNKWADLSNTNDLTIGFTNAKNAGTAEVTITGKKNYTGTIHTTFTILPKTVTSDMIGNIANQIFTGSEITPEITVKYGSAETLSKDIDYSITYENNVDCNSVSNKSPVVIIEGMGNYAGSASKAFTINQADLSNSMLVKIGTLNDEGEWREGIPDQVECGTKITPEITVRMGDYTLIPNKDYKVYFGSDSDKRLNVSPGNDNGVVTIVPADKSNFKASTQTDTRKVNGQEAKFNIIEVSPDTPEAEKISISGDTGLIDDKIYVNKTGSGVNETLSFTIESLMLDGTASSDPIYAVSESNSNSIFTFEVINTSSDSTGNVATLKITGKQVGYSKITLITRKGFSRDIDVIVRQPAKSIYIKKDNQTVSDGETRTVLELHDYQFTAEFDDKNVTDSVEWALDSAFTVSQNNVAIITPLTEDGRTVTVSTLKNGAFRLYARTKPGEVSPGGTRTDATYTVKVSNVANAVFIKKGTEVTGKERIPYQNNGTGFIELAGSATAANGSSVTEELVWTSSDQDVVTIETNSDSNTVKVIGKAPGTATITYGSRRTAEDGTPLVYASCEIEVYVNTSSIELDQQEVSIIYGKTATLTATLNAFASDEFIWTSGNDSIVSISGTDDTPANSQTVTLTGLQPNKETIITVKAKNGNKQTQCKVTVSHSNASDVRIEGTGATKIDENKEISVLVGDRITLKGIATNASQDITETPYWKTSIRNIVVFDGCIETDPEIALIANYPGDVELTYTGNAASDTITIHVVETITAVTLNDSSLEIEQGKSKTLRASFNGEAKGKFKWEYDPSVIKVEGISTVEENSNTVTITALKRGTTTKISVSAEDGSTNKAECTITIPENKAESIRLNKTAAELKVGESVTLTGTATRESGDVTEELTWKSSDDKVATVTASADGTSAVVKAVGAGTATITYGSKLTSGVSASCTITVTAPEGSEGGNDNPSGSGDQQGTTQNPDQKQEGGQQQKPEEVTAPKTGESRDVDGLTYKATGSDTVAFVAPAEGSTTSKVKIPATVTIGGQTFKVTEVKDGAFEGRTDIKSVTIGANVEKIGNNAFKGCTELTKIVIPKKIKSIGKNAFAGCKKLKTVQIKSTSLKKIGKGAFKTIKKGAKIKVPKSKKAAYKKLLKKSGLPKNAKVK